MKAAPGTTKQTSWDPATEAERAAAPEQLERILANPHFKNSKRYPCLFRHVVEQSLKGRADQLKERTLGIEAFGRDPDYDTNLDPVVRTTAGEIRKRIAQYYHEPGHEAEIRIDLPAGSYVPEFRLPVGQRIAPPTAPARRRWPAYLLGLGLLAALIGLGAIALDETLGSQNRAGTVLGADPGLPRHCTAVRRPAPWTST